MAAALTCGAKKVLQIQILRELNDLIQRNLCFSLHEQKILFLHQKCHRLQTKFIRSFVLPSILFISFYKKEIKTKIGFIWEIDIERLILIIISKFMVRRKEEWCAKDYKKAGEKHFIACAKLVDLVNVPNNNVKDRAIFHEILYLSGYIVECYLKFGILSALHYENQTISKEDLVKLHLITHDIELLKQRYIDTCNISSNNINWNLHLKNWSEELRYHGIPSHHKDFFQEIITHIKDTITSIRNNILKNF